MSPEPPIDPNTEANAAFQRHRNELDITVGAPSQRLGTVVAILISGVVVAAVFGSGALRDWAFELTLDAIPGAELLFAAADMWHRWMDWLGAPDLFDAVHAWVERWRLG